MHNSITDISGVKVGHEQNKKAKTGCTVITCGKMGMSCGIDIRGGAPGTRETALLAPCRKIDKIHAVLLTGGSAYGLDAAGGVMKYLEENNIGYKTGDVRVPIVPTAVIYDLAVGDADIRPDKKMGYRAALNASRGKVKTESVGAGTGATVGKIKGMKYCMKSGIGTASIKSGDLIVGALVVTNALGNIYNPENGDIIAGAVDERGNYFKSNSFIKNNLKNKCSNNTTLAVVASNGCFDKAENKRIAVMAQDGISRTIKPVHTMYDGDIVFSISSDKIKEDINKVGYLAAEVTARAVINSVKQAKEAEK